MSDDPRPALNVAPEASRTEPRRRVLLLTSHPLDARDGADKELTYTIASGLPDVDFTWFGRAGRRHREPLASGRRVAMISRDGMPGPLERAQAAALGLMAERRVDLLHAVVTIGPQFEQFVRLRRRLLGSAVRPAIHTVPGVADRRYLDGVPELGTTVALSRATQEILVDAGFSDVRLVAPGIDLSRWARRPRAEMDERGPLVAFAGHYDIEGGVWDTVAGLGALVRRGRPVRALFLMRPRPGQDEVRERTRLVARAAAAGLPDVTVRGRVEDMPATLGEVDLVLLPARELGGKADVPLTLIEAMAIGRPVVVTDIPQIEALGHAATRVPVGDPEALADALGALFASPGLWESRSDLGHDLVRRQFSSHRMVATYRDLYDELLDGPGGAPGLRRT
ncbi:hypothetical protein BH10ACT10_BH10ACT10_01940 [soil metagenome]